MNLIYSKKKRRAVKLSYINKQMKKNIKRLHTHFLGLAGITGITASIFSLGLIAKPQGFVLVLVSE
jgi:hypothetical protein